MRKVLASIDDPELAATDAARVGPSSRRVAPPALKRSRLIASIERMR
jgi:hypothetical protein